MARRVLNRPREGWAADPNADLPYWLAFVVLMFGAALFFSWSAAAVEAAIGTL
jgi:hypothetical protein